MPTTKPRARIIPEDKKALYLCDGGALLCGAHLGMTAAYSGRDISGQEVLALSKPDLEYLRKETGAVAECDTCCQG